jgi:hypothetical protein
MKNFEKKELMENTLRKQITKRRIIQVLVFFGLLAIGILFWALREASKEVIVHGEEFLDGILAWETVRYNENYVVGMIIGFVGASMAMVFLLTDLIFCRFDTVEANGHYITVYRGMTKNTVYVNGEEKDSVGMFSFTYVLETKLPDGVKIGVTFARGAFMLAHITFSDNNPSVDL